MAQHIDNLRGEQGSIYVKAGETFTASTYGVDAVHALVREDGTILSAITQPFCYGVADNVVGFEYLRGEMIWGFIASLTVQSGSVQVFFHRRSDVVEA